MNKKIFFILPMLFGFCYGTETYVPEGAGTFWIWIALFVLGLVGIVILFVSSFQIRKTERVYKEMFQQQLELEKNQAKLLSAMSEEIRGMVSKTLKTKEDEIKPPFCETQDNKAIREVSVELDRIEEKLLTVTNDLIEFLRLKAGKIEIIHEKFNLNNVLNEISGYICNKYQGKQVDLIFDINNNVPRLLIGDSLHLGHVINSIIEHMISRLDSGEVRLEISMYHTYEDKVELEFLFNATGDGVGMEALESLFDPYYDEQSSTYHGLGLFVSKNLADMMDGTLTAQSQSGEGTAFTLTLPLKMYDGADKRRYRLPEKELTIKKVFIVDNNYHSALAIKKTFAYFRHEVTVLSREAFLKEMPNLMPYDIILLNENLFTPRLTDYLGKVKSKKALKVISLKSLLHIDEAQLTHEIIDVHLHTPLNQERVFELIVKMYSVESETPKRVSGGKKIQVCKSMIPETKNVTRHSFSAFEKKHILIVDDNAINQKVLSSILLPEGVRVSLANNGQEAVDMIQKSQMVFDLVLMDINMPILDGYAATEMIRRDGMYETLPIVAFTALVLDSEIEKMFKSGVSAFLPKPLNIGKLYTALSMFLSMSTMEPLPKADEVSEKEQEVVEKLDVEQGIKYASNNNMLYMELLSEFLSAYRSSDMLFKKLVHEYRHEQIKMLCIDMRGLTGAIGAHDMQELVSMIFQAILYRKHNTLPDFIDRYHQEITALNNAIEKYLLLNDYSTD